MDYSIENIKTERCNINLEKSCKDWFMWKAKTMGMNMSQLMAFVLTSYKDTQQNADALKSLSNVAENADSQAVNRELLDLLKAIKEDSDSDELAPQ